MIIPALFERPGRWALTLPLRLVLGLPLVLMLCLFGSMNLTKGLKLPHISDSFIGWVATLVVRLALLPLFLVFGGLFGEIKAQF